MITVNDKLNLFTKRIIDKRQNAYDDKVKQLEEKMVVEFESRKKMLEKDRSKYETSLLKGIKGEREQRLSNARSERKRRLLLKRKEMIDTLLEGVKKYTYRFVETDDYLHYLEKVFHENRDAIRKLGEFTAFINARDFKSHQLVLRELFKNEGLSCKSFVLYEKTIIGGVVLLKEDGTTRIDLSLDSVIEDNKRYMGQLIYGILEKAGETHE